jgi:dTDP-4-amino-4,6-dideoxygalactose transaminase
MIPYVDLGGLTATIKDELLAVVEDVLLSGQYVLGPEVSAFEKEFAEYCGTKYCLGVASGTDALVLVLKALGVGPGDEVITAPNSFVASGAAIALTGARPVFCDVDEDLNIDPDKLEAAITPRTKALMPVHLTGRVARMPEINDIAGRHNLAVIEDAAQGVSAARDGRRAGSWGTAGCFSLHPLKNLHAFGDGGAITTNDQRIVDYVRQARNLGLKTRNECEFWCDHSRLDSIHAAMLRVQLRHMDAWNQERRRLASRYNEALRPYVIVPDEREGEYCTWQTYVVQSERRDELFDYLVAGGVDCKVHYPIPIHQQECARDLGYSENDFPVTRKVVGRILSLPLFPGLADEAQDRVIELIRSFHEGCVQLPARAVQQSGSLLRRSA